MSNVAVNTDQSTEESPEARLVQSQPSVGHQLGIAVGLLLVFTFITGVVYPLLVTGIGQVFFSDKANGSLVVQGDKVVGSRLIGQPFEDPKHFWSRLSATSPAAYNSGLSSGSNFGPTNEALTKASQARVDALREADPGNTAPIPVDLATASGSGLDPHISLAAAEYQMARVARTRGLPETRVRELVAANTEGRDLGILGEPRVNVLMLNLALDAAR